MSHDVQPPPVSCQGVTYLTHRYLLVGDHPPVCVACQEHIVRRESHSGSLRRVHVSQILMFYCKVQPPTPPPPPPLHDAVFVADRHRRPISGDNRSMYMYVRHRRPPDRCRSSSMEFQLFRQIIMCVMQCQYDVDLHLLFCFDHDLFPTSMLYLDFCIHISSKAMSL